ncbi:hypothetical protein ABEV74_12975 [Paenibacillus cisolokensis]|jgi:hypothetical protein|uniref:Uncharacterized protein n=1 Tax=Paenibacillus cisolokensis TaxID=1658519 RepID=A0ABQ4N1J1_9BACL|nr:MULTISPECIES: hypothetical protein [Paenibacillus]ALS25911.1 hypothetical protein IJ21_04790 [Paenibacillus sp. 32O-W]GIQ62050.1 hypothetical protein PACILC2_06180 [Paenibacillus cisolokensis]
MKHRNEPKSRKLRTLLIAMSLMLMIPYSAAFAEGDAAGKAAEDQKPNVAAGVTVIRANGDVVTPLGAGEWDYLGKRTTSSSENPSNYVHSGGGDFKYKVASGPSGGAWYQLREYDPDNADDIITDPYGYSFFYLYPGDTLIYRGISGAVDGTNKKAEFYVYETFSGSATVQYWD